MMPQIPLESETTMQMIIMMMRMGATFRIVALLGWDRWHRSVTEKRNTWHLLTWVPLITTSRLVPVAPTRSVATTPTRGYLLGIFTLSSS